MDVESFLLVFFLLVEWNFWCEICVFDQIRDQKSSGTVLTIRSRSRPHDGRALVC